ncbi:MAG TPA: hypothetical protein VGI03_09140 [Verrucomicrobiae bacterium]|jgi:DNA-directed RNA polymerase subunit RPC12/RpoP
MAEIKTTCPRCGQPFRCGNEQRGTTVNCPNCKSLIVFPRGSKRKLFVYAVVSGMVIFAAGVGSIWPTNFLWPDRRPIGVLFLASNYHSSTTNPRGWFNDDTLDVAGPEGQQRFRKALLDYTDRSIAILKKEGAQGVIVWDLEGEQYPHKTSYIGDPRLLSRLAPEMDPVADEFFQRLHDAGLRVGLTVRPQQLVFGKNGQPRQTGVLDINQLLLNKIDYARSRWKATLFYVDSNDGMWRPDEMWQLRCLAGQRPDILLIPEHHGLFYRAFSAPYVDLHKAGSFATPALARKLFPNSFQVLNLGDTTNDPIAIAAAQRQGDVLLFRAWYWNSDCQLLERIEQK